MSKLTKNRKDKSKNIDLSKVYNPIEAIKILKENSYVKFNETLEISINLKIDTEKTDQNIKGMLNLPKGTGKNIRVAVIAKGDKATEAKDAGADLVGDEDLAQDISSGKINFDLLIADEAHRCASAEHDSNYFTIVLNDKKIRAKNRPKKPKIAQNRPPKSKIRPKLPAAAGSGGACSPPFRLPMPFALRCA